MPTDPDRGGPRIESRFRAVLGSERQDGAGVLVDLSERGARLELTSATPALGAQVRVQARLPDQGEPLMLTGLVTQAGPDGFALEFEKHQPALQHLIEHISPLAAAPVRQADAGTGAGPGGPRPSLREARAHCFADGVWISGNVVLPGRRRLIDVLNQDDQPFVRVRDALPSGAAKPLAFLALRVDALSVVVPEEPEQAHRQEGTVGRFTARRLTFVLRGCSVTGSVDVLASLRVSDYLMNSRGFAAARDCTLVASGDAQPRHAAAAILNLRRVIGVSEG